MNKISQSLQTSSAPATHIDPTPNTTRATHSYFLRSKRKLESEDKTSAPPMRKHKPDAPVNKPQISNTLSFEKMVKPTPRIPAFGGSRISIFDINPGWAEFYQGSSIRGFHNGNFY